MVPDKGFEPSLAASLALCLCRWANPANGAQTGIRTRTVRILSALPLPLGYLRMAGSARFELAEPFGSTD